MTFAPKGGYQKPNKKSLKITDGVSKPPVVSRDVVLPHMSRPVTKTSLYYFNLYKLVWRWSMLSLPFDLCLLLLLPLAQFAILSELETSVIEQICVTLMFIGASWFIKNWTLTQLTGWKTKRSKFLNLIERNPVLIILCLVLLVGIEVYLKLGEFGAISIVLTIIIVLGALKSVKQSWKERLLKEQNLAKDLTAQVESFNSVLFLIHLIPLLAARLIVLISAITFPLALQHEPNFLLAICVGCIMLSLMQAEEQYFMISCRRCGVKTSRFLEQYEACLACLQNEKRK